MKTCLVIGVQEHIDKASLSDLPAATNDADVIYSTLINSSIGGYSTQKSRKLISPTLQDIKNAMVEIASSKENNDSIFTFFFAGHGAVVNDTFYLCVRDTRGNLLSSTALSLHEVISFALETGFSEINMVIDSCESGGSIADLSKLASINNLGFYQSPSISILAACYANQNASEGETHGLLCEQVLKCLVGEYVLNQLRPYLSLSEIAEHISQLDMFNDEQKPVFHGASLSGPGQFSKNLNYTGAISENPAELLELHKASKALFSQDTSLQQRYLKIVSSLEELNPFELNVFLKKIKSPLSEKQFEEIAIGIFLNLKVHAKQFADSSIFLDIARIFHGYSLSIVDHAIRGTYQQYFISELKDAYDICINQLVSELQETHAFSYPEDSLSGFILYPKRVTEAAGILSQYPVFFSNTRVEEIKQLAGQLTRKCKSGFRIVDDEQAQDIVSMLSAHKKGVSPFASDINDILKSLYEDLSKSACQILEIRKDDDDIYRYLLFRGAPDRVAPPTDALSRPCISLSIILFGLHLLGEHLEINNHLESFDHQDTRLFIPDSYLDFFEPIIQKGLNLEFGIGRDVFQATDVSTLYTTKLIALLNNAKRNVLDGDLLACASNAAVYKDRQALCLW